MLPEQYFGTSLRAIYFLKGVFKLGIFPVPGIETKVFMNAYNSLIIYTAFLSYKLPRNMNYPYYYK